MRPDTITVTIANANGVSVSVPLDIVGFQDPPEMLRKGLTLTAARAIQAYIDVETQRDEAIEQMLGLVESVQP